jgi:hypothetical protein
MPPNQPKMNVVIIKKWAKPSQESQNRARLRRELELQEELREESLRPIRAKRDADLAKLYSSYSS